MLRIQTPEVTKTDLALMDTLLKQGRIQHKFAQRIQVVLNRARGASTTEVARFLGIDPVTVSRYVKRFNEGGVHVLVTDKTRRPGRAPVSTAAKKGSRESFAERNRIMPPTGEHGNWPNESVSAITRCPGSCEREISSLTW